MKVLTVVDPMTPLSKMHHVGASMLPYDLCQNLSGRNDIEMSLLVYNDLGVDKLSNVTIIDLGEPKSRYQQQVAKRLKEIINDYDIVHVHISTPGFVKYLVEFDKSVQSKIIYTMHTWTNSLAVSYFYYDYFKKLVDDSLVNIVFLTKVQGEMLLSKVGSDHFNHPERIHYIYNAVNVNEVIEEQCKLDRVIAVGRMVESKGIDKIVTACIEANQKLLLVSPSWRCTPKEQKYCDYVMSLINKAPEGLITVSRGMSHDDLMKEIMVSESSILFSTFDVFSLFVLESLMMHTKVLAYNSGSTAEVCKILKGCGVTKFDSRKELVEILKNKLYDPIDRRLPEDCTYNKFVDNYYRLYCEVNK